MELILIGLLIAIIAGSQFMIDAMLTSIIPMAFYSEKYIASTLNMAVFTDFTKLFDLFFSFGVSLIVLKFLKKGFEIYVGWYEGDADSDPLNLVTNFLRAMVIAICFPMFYDLLVQITTEIMDLALAEVNALASQQSLADAIIHIVDKALLQAIGGVILIVCWFLLWLQFMMRGVEMFVMRIGLPIACVGLLDSDKGVFAPYMKKFFMNAFTVLVQVVLVKLSLMIMGEGHIFYSIAICLVAMKTPKFLQEFMLVSGSGGVMNTVYHTSRMVQMGSKLLTKGAAK